MILLQAPADTGLSLVSFLIALAIMLGIFLLLRAVVLWYWKVDTIVKNQEETNRLLRSINATLERQNDDRKTSSTNPPAV